MVSKIKLIVDTPSCQLTLTIQFKYVPFYRSTEFTGNSTYKARSLHTINQCIARALTETARQRKILNTNESFSVLDLSGFDVKINLNHCDSFIQLRDVVVKLLISEFERLNIVKVLNTVVKRFRSRIRSNTIKRLLTDSEKENKKQGDVVLGDVCVAYWYCFVRSGNFETVLKSFDFTYLRLAKKIYITTNNNLFKLFWLLLLICYDKTIFNTTSVFVSDIRVSHKLQKDMSIFTSDFLDLIQKDQQLAVTRATMIQ